MKSVVLAVGSHWDSGNSVSLQFKAIADELVKRGHQVILLVPGQVSEKVIDIGNPLVFTWPSKRPTKLRDAIFCTALIANISSLQSLVVLPQLEKIFIMASGV